ncbi:translation initiation factor IF-2, chloroplastic [Artemisia annua]|uniref:Translation initiation factor IF-2, chloroplastic n=1 Tax=Artemisia annua TaxID=35608 RepID=A0A2U1QEC4_ARTAN|nr:translation initiation factor IF-2, chloroplastic [Artemisia annua]
MAKKKEIFDEEDLDQLQDHHYGSRRSWKSNTFGLYPEKQGGSFRSWWEYTRNPIIDGTMRPCVFLDTPEHEAFGAMRARGARNGTLKKDVVVCGEAFEKRVDAAGPSISVQVIGLNNVPVASDEFEVVDSLDITRARAEYPKSKIVYVGVLDSLRQIKDDVKEERPTLEEASTTMAAAVKEAGIEI